MNNLELYPLKIDLKIVTENTKTLEELLHKIKNQPGISNTKTLVVLSPVINNPSPGPD